MFFRQALNLPSEEREGKKNLTMHGAAGWLEQAWPTYDLGTCINFFEKKSFTTSCYTFKEDVPLPNREIF